MFTYKVDTPEFQDISTVTKKGSRWYNTPNGPYPSVTTILSHGGDKQWLADWRNMLGPKKADKESKRCADRGTAVHEMCELFLMNKDVDEVVRGRQREHVALFNQIRMALRKIDQIRAQEVALWSDQFKIAGRVDCIAEYNGTLSVIDFKTSNGMKDESMIEDYFLQCTAYALMYFELYNEPIEDIVVIITSEKGLMPLVFKRKIDDYVAPLLARVNKFHESLQKV